MEPKVSLPKRPILLCRTSIVLDGDKSDIRESKIHETSISD